MAFNEQTYQDIQDYLDHKMSPSAQQAFERKLSANEALAKEVQLHAEMQELFADTPENQLRKSLQVLSDEAEEERPGLSWKWFAMIPLLIGLVGFLMYQSSSNSKQSTTNNSTTESPAVPSSNELSTTNQDKQNINLESIQLTDNGDVTSPNIKGTTNTVPSVSPLVTGIAPTAYTAPSIVFLRKDLPSIIDDNKKGFFVLDSMQNAPDTINMVKDTIQKEPIADVGELVPIIETPNIIDPTTSSYINAPEEPFVMVLSAPVGSDTPFEDNVYLDSIIASQATSPAPFVSVLSTPADTLYYYVGKLGGVEKAKYADTLAAKLRMQIELPEGLDPKRLILSTTNNINETWGSKMDILKAQGDGIYEMDVAPLVIQIPGLFYYKVYHHTTGELYFIGKYVLYEKSKKQIRRDRRKEKRRLRKLN